MSRAALALGANLGPARAALRAAVAGLAAEPGIAVLAVSGLWRTAPVGGPEQPDYLNAVVILTTAMPPLTLLQELQRIENRHGRVRTQHWGPRCLDLDIIDVEGVASANPRLTLPHPRAAQRRFVLEPWHAIDPEARIANMRIADLLPTLLYQEVSLVENPRR